MSQSVVTIVNRGPQVVTSAPAVVAVRVEKAGVLIEAQPATVVEVFRGPEGKQGPVGPQGPSGATWNSLEW